MKAVLTRMNPNFNPNLGIDFQLEKLKPLVGGTITGLVRTSEPAIHEGYFDDEFFGFTITTPNGKKYTLILMSDDEGVGPVNFKLTEEKNT